MTYAELATLLAQQHAENAQLRSEWAGDRAALAASRAEISKLLAQLAKLSDQVTELLAIVKRKKGKPPKPEKPPTPPPDVSEEVQTVFEERPVLPEPPPKVIPEPAPRKPTGRKPLPESLPADESIVIPRQCACCQGKNLDIVDEVVETKLDVVKQHQRRRIVHRKTARCRDCLKRTTAEAPPAPFERSKVTCDWLSWLIVQKFVLLVPLDRIRRYLGSQGLALSISFLVSQIEAAAELLDAIDGEHWKQLLAGNAIATDGTGLKVLLPKLGSHQGYIEVYHWDQVVVFQYEAEKGGQTQADKLQKFKGFLVCDAESRYNQLFSKGVVLEAGCNAHGRRKFRDAEAVQPLLAVEGGRFLTVLYDEEEKAREEGLHGPQLLAWRQEKIKPITETFRQWMTAVQPTLTPSDPLYKAIQYYQNHWTALMRFLDHPDLPPDNSASEREFQAVAKLRLNCLFAGGTEGAHRAAVLLGIAATCRRLGLDVQAYLTWAFERQGTHRQKYGMSAAELTPAGYKASLSR